MKDRSFTRVVRGDRRRPNGSLLGVLPIVVVRYEAAVAIVQFKRCVLQCVRDALQAWAACAEEHVGRAVSKNNCAANQNVVTLADESAGGNVGQLRVHREVEIIDFYQADTRCCAFAGKDSGVGARIQALHDGRIIIVLRRNGCRFYPSSCVSLTVVVSGNERAGESRNRVSDRHVFVHRQQRTEPRTMISSAGSPCDETCDQHVSAGAHRESRGDVREVDCGLAH